MELKIIDLEGKETKKIKLPSQFNEEFRPDLIKKAVQTIENNLRQRYGADPRAGMKHSAELSRRRRKYRGSYGLGISRVPRKILSRRGTRMNWVGAEAPGTVGGRRSHPPKAEKEFSQKMNVKERKKAIRSALNATIIKEIVEKRGHKIPKEYPFVLGDIFEKQNKTKEMIKVFETIGLKDELKRSSEKKIRAGKGKMRNRKYISKKGALIVVSEECQLSKSVNNIPGFEIITVKQINTKLLAPGCMPGRLTLFTEKAILAIEKEKLFM